MTNSKSDPQHGRRGIQSVEVGGRLLLALAGEGRALALKDLAQAADMTPAKAHPYLVSFIKLGLVGQEAGSGHYGLGPLAMQLGMISLQQYEPVRLTAARIEELATQSGHTVAIVAWGNKGPTVIRVAEAPSPVHITMRHGTVMSLRGTASGRMFAAHLPRAEVRAALKLAGEPLSLDAAHEALLERVREQGLASTQGTVVAGVAALAAPVFDHAARIVLCVTVIGPSGHIDLRPRGPLGQALKGLCEQVSRQLGA